MDMQSKNQIGSGNVFQFIDDVMIARVIGDFLILPFGKRMGTGSPHHQALHGSELEDFIPEEATSFLASATFWQIFVPTSTTDWCISALTCSFSVIFPPSTILDM